MFIQVRSVRFWYWPKVRTLFRRHKCSFQEVRPPIADTCRNSVLNVHRKIVFVTSNIGWRSSQSFFWLCTGFMRLIRHIRQTRFYENWQRSLILATPLSNDSCRSVFNQTGFDGTHNHLTFQQRWSMNSDRYHSSVAESWIIQMLCQQRIHWCHDFHPNTLIFNYHLCISMKEPCSIANSSSETII